jgi:uncharacterized membrane protein
MRSIKFIPSVLSKEELPSTVKALIIIHMYKKGDETDLCISLLSATYKILSNILFLGLMPDVDKIIGHQCLFSLTVQLLIIYYAFIRYIREK